MRVIIKDQEYDNVIDRPRIFARRGRIIENMELHHCNFYWCVLSLTHKPHLRTLVRNVRIVDCYEANCDVNTAIIEDCEINGLRTYGAPLRLLGTVFKHVVLRGQIGSMASVDASNWLGGSPDWLSLKRKKCNAIDASNVEYYKHVDWALDIREAEFRQAYFIGVPASLIRRDPTTQFIVKREKLLDNKWRQIIPQNTSTTIDMDIFLESGIQDMVFVAPKGAPDLFDKKMRYFEKLRKVGIAEPD